MCNEEFIQLLPPEFQFILVISLNSFLVRDRILLSAKERFERHHRWLSLDVAVAEVASYLSTAQNMEQGLQSAVQAKHLNATSIGPTILV